jgi:hypothetical protein
MQISTFSCKLHTNKSNEVLFLQWMLHTTNKWQYTKLHLPCENWNWVIWWNTNSKATTLKKLEMCTQTKTECH